MESDPFDVCVSSDATFGNSSMMAFKMCLEAHDAIREMEYRRDVFAREFLREISCGYSHALPFELQYEFVKGAQSRDAVDGESPDVVETGIAWHRSRILLRLFGESDLKGHRIEIGKVMFLRFDESAAQIRFVVDGGKSVYMLKVPYPGRIEGPKFSYEGLTGQVVVCYRLDMKETEETGIETWHFVGGVDHSSYDWKIPVRAIVEDIVTDGGKVVAL